MLCATLYQIVFNWVYKGKLNKHNGLKFDFWLRFDSNAKDLHNLLKNSQKWIENMNFTQSKKGKPIILFISRSIVVQGAKFK